MININGTTFSGNSIVVNNGRVIINGKDQTPDGKEISIIVTGNIEELDVDYCKEVVINGNVTNARTGSGDLTCNSILGNAQSGSGDIECESIGGSVQTGSGDVKSTTIQGSVRTGSGDIKYKK